MKVLVAEDDPLVRHIVAKLLAAEYEVVTAQNGNQAWDAIRCNDGPRLAVLDWQMPGINGTDICRRARELPDTPTYLILLTATRKSAADVLEGFDAGADDFIQKPFDVDELRARVAVGRRVLQLQQALSQRVAELQEALGRVHKLEGLLPICAWCKRIRNDQNYWEQLEIYIAEHTDASFTHGICPDCCEKLRAEGNLVAKRA
jgi:sigma-B regulation protein RsbU (phosphoserine phosphatase)